MNMTSIIELISHGACNITLQAVVLLVNSKTQYVSNSLLVSSNICSYHMQFNFHLMAPSNTSNMRLFLTVFILTVVVFLSTFVNC